MPRQELAFVKAISNTELSAAFLWELRKAVVAGKKEESPCGL
jgi:hypothetical protein